MPPKVFREGAPWWGLVSPDKLSIRVNAAILNLDAVGPLQTRNALTVTNAGGAYWDLNINAEWLIPGIPLLHQVASGLACLATQGVFRFDVSLWILQVLRSDWDWNAPSTTFMYVEFLKWIGATWVCAEVAADFHVNNRPVKLNNKDAGHKFRSTLYSNDGIKRYRQTMVNGRERRESKGARKDFVIEYNRARKIGADCPIWRIELRLQRHHLDRLSIYDLVFDFHSWLLFRQAWLSKFLRRAIPPGSWQIRKSATAHDHWLFLRVLADAGWHTF